MVPVDGKSLFTLFTHRAKNRAILETKEKTQAVSEVVIRIIVLTINRKLDSRLEVLLVSFLLSRLRSKAAHRSYAQKLLKCQKK